MNTKRRNFRLTFAASAVLLAAIAFTLTFVLGNLRGARLDMTSNQLFTMSPAAAKILQGLQVPVQVKLYITPAEKMPTQYRNLERDISEQLRNFEQVSKGMFEFSVYNPQDDEAMQETLLAKNIRPFQVQSIVKDEIGVKLIWSAISIAYKDKPEEILPQMLPQSLASLEQDIIGPIHRLTRERTPKVAVYGPKKTVDQQLAMMYLQQGMQPPEPQEQFSRIADLLGQGHYDHEYTDLTAESPIPEDADLLLVMAAETLNERQVYEINRALRGGMPLVIAVQAHEYAYTPGRSGSWQVQGQDVVTGLEGFLGELGLAISEDHFMDASNEVLEIPREVNLGGLRMQTREPVKLPIQIRVTEDQMFQESPIVNRIGSLFYLWGTPITLDPDQIAANGLQVTNLIESSNESWQVSWGEGPVPGSVFNPANQTMLGPQTLAVLAEGTFPDTFADQPIPAWPTAPAADAAETPAAAPGPPAPVNPAASRLLLIGCARMFDDGFLTAHQNPLLLLNAVDYLAGSQEVLAIRSKALTNRVIKPVTANEKVLWRIFAVLFVPVILTAFGIIRSGMRRKEATHYREELKRVTSLAGR